MTYLPVFALRDRAGRAKSDLKTMDGRTYPTVWDTLPFGWTRVYSYTKQVDFNFVRAESSQTMMLHTVRALPFIAQPNQYVKRWAEISIKVPDVPVPQDE